MKDFDFNQYYQNHEVDLSWLNKPSQHGFRWRCTNGSWRKSKRRVSSVDSFRKAILEIIQVTSISLHHHGLSLLIYQI